MINPLDGICNESPKGKRTKKTHIWSSWLRDREQGEQKLIGSNDHLSRELYSSMRPVSFWDPIKLVKHPEHGAVFNLEFTPDGSLIVAACERKSILVFDPLNADLIHQVDDAHNNCVNCVRFLDSRMFATCSDDTTVALWDIRFLKHKIRSLKGHSNWVKNIEYASDVGLLVTSGFDGSIYTWDINRYTEGDIQFKRVFHTEGLMRTKITPDNSKLVLCTTGGYLMVIHNLNLDTLSTDLLNFQPNMYRLMQLSNTPFHLAYNHNHVFRAKRNCVELITDFPRGNDAEVISSLQVHPHGWCVLSRNTSNDENSEWTCVHDIQDMPGASEDCTSDSNLPDTQNKAPEVNNMPNNPIFSGSSASSSEGAITYPRPVVHIRFDCRQRAGASSDGTNRNATERNDNGADGGADNLNRHTVDVTLRISAAEARQALEAMAATLAVAEASSDVMRIFGSNRTNNNNNNEASGNNPSTSSRVGENASQRTDDDFSINLDNDDEDDEGEGDEADDEADEDEEESADANREGLRDPIHLDLGERAAYVLRTGSQQSSRTFLLLGPDRTPAAAAAAAAATSSSSSGPNSAQTKDPSSSATASESPNPVDSSKIFRNKERLMHYIAEPNVGRGFIKELCFSTDGRLVCSPYGNGVRLLSFNSRCSELCDCVPSSPTTLHEIAASICHPNVVVSTKFSPTHFLLAAGCMSGKISFFHPRQG